MSENKRGGAREGSGRKSKAPTTTINFRVPVAKADFLKPLVSGYIKGLLNEPVPTSGVKDTGNEDILPVKTNLKAKTKTQPIKNEVNEEPTMAELWAKRDKK